jgi:hypothetical protein
MAAPIGAKRQATVPFGMFFPILLKIGVLNHQQYNTFRNKKKEPQVSPKLPSPNS